MRQSLFDIDAGSAVAVARSKLVHTALGSTYWIMDPFNKIIYHVAGEAYGRDLYKLLKIERPAKDQEACSNLANELLEESQYRGERSQDIRKLLKRKNYDRR
jgi:hypothetical protein